MIVIKIFQGPGNQLFQIAFGLAAARRLNTTLKLDLDWYKDYSYHRAYILDRFNIDAEVATPKEIYDIKTCNASNFIAYKWNQLNRLYLRPYYQRPVIKEPIDKFDVNLTRITNNTYVEGYFTSLDFFSDQWGFIKEQLTFRSAPSDTNKRMIDTIQSEKAVAISFRLGDFLSNPWMNVTSVQYYQRCMDYLNERYENLRFYVFSDDVEWVKGNFKFNQPARYMDYNAPDYMEDFRLLTHFNFHVIPNSTFSWWGAFLAGDKDKTVLAPEYWLSPDKEAYADVFNGKMVDFSHVIPAEWIRIPNIISGDTYISK